MPAMTLQGAVSSSGTDLLHQLTETEQRAAAAERRIVELEKSRAELAKAHDLALAQQTALALELHRFSVESKKQAILHEQWKAARDRALELEKANNAMKRTAVKVSAATNLSVFLKELLLEICTQLEADAGHLTTYNAATRRLHTEALVQGGRLEQEDFPTDCVLQKENFFDLIVEKGRPVSFDFANDAHLFFPGTHAYHMERGHTYTYAVPLLIEDRPLGHIGIATKSAKRLVMEQLGFLEALAQQAALALELNRLSLEAKDQAIFHEQERAAQQRAAELAKANEALRNCVDELTREQSPEGMLRSFLGQAVKVSGASAGAILRRNGGTEFEFVLVNRGVETAAAEDVIAPESNEEVKCASAEDRHGYFSELAAGKPRWRKVDEILTDVLPTITRFHQEAGNQMLYDFPYKVGGEVKGYLGLAYTEPTPPSAVVQETISALSTQVGLALEFQRISAQVEQAAIAREQEKAAQQRTAELSKANAALSLRDGLLTAATKAVQQLLGSEDLDLAVPGALRLMGEAAAMHRVKVFMQKTDTNSNQSFHELMFEWWTDSLQSQKSLGLDRFEDKDTMDYILPMQQGRSMWEPIEQVNNRLRPHFERAGMRSMGIVPLFVSGRYAGLVAFDDCVSSRVWSQAEMDALTLAASAIGGAIHRREEDRARAAEKERATRQRVAELVNANHALRDSVQAVAQSADFDQSLSEIVLRIATTAGADQGHLFVYDSVANTLQSEFWFEHGFVHWEGDTSGPEWLRRAFDADVTPAFRVYLEQQKMVYANLEKADDDVRTLCWPGVIDWHLAHGRKAAAAIPILVGEQALGVLGLAWISETSFSEEQLEVIAALSNHAALVMQLRQMERHAREQAVSHEKSRATTEERNRIAREMHDTLLQGFAGVTMQLRAVTKQLRSSDGALASQVDQALNEGVSAMHEARRAVGDMRGQQAARASLRELLASVLETERERHPQVSMDLSCINDVSDMTEERTENLFRIAREAFRNALQHARATRISIGIDRQGNFVRLCVSDDGMGFDVANAVRTAGHWGLAGMRERAATLGGSCEIHSTPGHGSRISVQIAVHG